MKCNSCHRTGTHNLKLGFAQAKPTHGQARFTISIECDGKWCIECAQRAERKARAGFFDEIVNAYIRQEVAIMFNLRGWGEPSWNETSVEFYRDKSEEMNAVRLEQMEKV